MTVSRDADTKARMPGRIWFTASAVGGTLAFASALWTGVRGLGAVAATVAVVAALAASVGKQASP